MPKLEEINLHPQNVTVLGAGAWGIVLAAHLSRQGHRVICWDLMEEVVAKLACTRRHPKLPGFEVPAEVRLSGELEKAIDFSDDSTNERPFPDAVVVVVPSHGVGALAANWKFLQAEHEGLNAPWVVCSKGIDEETLETMAERVESVLGPESHDRIAAFSGPSFAAEVAQSKPTTVCAAAWNPELAKYVQALFMSDTLRVYTQDDVLGVELGGSLKNVVAIAAGVCDGLSLGDNSRAALITRGLAEMIRLGGAMGARVETFAGLAGMGDLILTCCGPLSRNHSFGELLAKGRTPDQALEEIGMVVEGMRTARSARALAQKHGVEMPIVQEVYAVIYESKDPRQAVYDLMHREAKPERVSQG